MFDKIIVNLGTMESGGDSDGGDGEQSVCELQSERN